MHDVRPAYDNIDSIRQLFMEYTSGLGMDLTFQNYDEEFATLPGQYGLPYGRLFIAYRDGKPAGCIALRKLGERGELKRFFVRPECRGLGIGRALLERALAEARDIGYREIVLDTRERLTVSIAMYKRTGFREIEPYYHNPYSDIVYLGMEL